jgi:UDP-arabinose 4-epimerase
LTPTQDGSRGTLLVTGGAGYVGSHACKALAGAGFLPVSYDNLVYGHENAVRWGPLERGDLLDRTRLDQVLSVHRPIAVLHFAAFAYVGESVADPGKYYRNNVTGSLTLLEAMRDHSIRPIVFSSTCATYGVPDRVPISEGAPQRPINPYGMSKLMVERMLTDFGAAHGLQSVALRYFNAAGATPSGEIGEDHSPETHLIPLVLDAAAGIRKDVTIFGTDYATPDGTCVRDYIHVSDLADAHVLALSALTKGAGRSAYNLGTGTGVSVRQVIDAVRRISGQPVTARTEARRAGDPAILVADAGLAGAELGWKPGLSDIETIVATAWRWHRRKGSPEHQKASAG